MLRLRSRLAAGGATIRFFSLSSSRPSRDGGSEHTDDFERRIFGSGTAPRVSFYDKPDRVEWSGSRKKAGGDDLEGSFFDTLNDGMESKLKKSAVSFAHEEMLEDNYKYRPDATFFPGQTYDVKDLDLTKPIVQKFPPRKGFKTTTEEALKKADFRNVRYLANFITEAGIIIKRSKTGISAKAQRRIAKEIKTARAFGLMPFTSMGTKPFSFGRSAKESDLTLQFADYNSTRLDDPAPDVKANPSDLYE